jgi:general secretion pathway protein B
MSYILDALKKSERDRHAGAASSAVAAGAHGVVATVPPWTWLTLGMAMTLFAGGAIWLWWPAPAVENAATAVKTGGVRDLTEQLHVPAATPAPAAPAARPAADAADIPFLRSLPEELRRSLPEMTVNIHVYTPDESQRMLYINNRQYRRGEFIGGVLIEDITPDGVLVNYHGVRFKLERPR